MLKTLKNILIIVCVIVCAALGGVAGWFAREKISPAQPDGTVTAKTFSAPMELPATDQGIVSFLSGAGFRKRGESWDELQPGTLVGRGDSVRTAEGGAADVQFGSLAVIRLRQNSAAAFEDINTRRGGSLSVRIIAGTVLFNVTKGAGKVTVITPDGNLSVVGTEFLVSVGEGGTYTAVRDGKVAVEGGAGVDAGFSVRMGAEASAKPEALTDAGKSDAEELGRLTILDIPESGLSRFARIIVETSPADAALFRDGQPCGRGSAALLAPFGKALKLSASKAGYKTHEIDVEVSSAEAEKRYLSQLEPDPDAPIKPSPEAGLQHILKLEAQIGILESEIKSRELLYRAVATQSSTLGSERDLLWMDAESSRKETVAARSEAAAARSQINNLETQIKSLKTALDQEKERVRQIMELLKE
jgi:outer membrane murein-binding lipoprotein Lpp